MAIQSKAQSLYGDDPAGVTLGKVDFQRCGAGPRNAEIMIAISMLKTQRLLNNSDVVLTELIAMPRALFERAQARPDPFFGPPREVSPLRYAVMRGLTCLEDHLEAELAFSARDIRNAVFRAAERCAGADQSHQALLKLFIQPVAQGDALIARVDELIASLEDDRRISRLGYKIEGEPAYTFTTREFWQS